MGDSLVRLLQNVCRCQLCCVQIIGAVPDLVRDIGLVAQIGSRLQDVFAIVEEALVEEDVALGVRDHCRIPPRLLPHVFLASLVIVSSTLLSPAIKGLLLEGIRVDRELVFVELDLVLVSGTPLHGAVSRLHEAYGRLLLPAGIICELDYFALLCLDDLGLDHGLYGLPAALMLLCLDLSA